MIQLTFRKPKTIPTIAMLTVVLICAWLAVWQLHRLEEKTALISAINEAQSLPPHEMSAHAEDLAEWRNVIARGTFLHEHELHATPRYYKGKLGYAILTPLAVTTAAGTQYIMVNRGWVPPEKKDAAMRTSGNTQELMIVEGAVRKSFKQKLFTPNNQPEKNIWLWYDLPAMAKATGLNLQPFLIDATAIKTQRGETSKDAPLPFPIEIKIRNDHQGYAITWFLLGLTALGVWAAHYIERRI